MSHRRPDLGDAVQSKRSRRLLQWHPISSVEKHSAETIGAPQCTSQPLVHRLPSQIIVRRVLNSAQGRDIRFDLLLHWEREEERARWRNRVEWRGEDLMSKTTPALSELSSAGFT